MGKQNATAAQLLAILTEEFARRPECEGVKAVQIFSCECEGEWTAAFQGIDAGTDGEEALREIMGRLSGAYALVPTTH